MGNLCPAWHMALQQCYIGLSYAIFLWLSHVHSRMTRN